MDPRSNVKPHYTPQRIAWLALLTAFSSVGRLVFTVPFLPNIQPMTAMLMLVTLHLGGVDGIIVSTLSILLTNMLLGMGPWTLHQVLTYAILMVLVGASRKLYQKHTSRSLILMALFAGSIGLLYGLIISLFSVWTYQIPSFWAYYLRGLPFDALHAVGNIGFFVLLNPLLAPILHKRFR